MVIGLPLIAGVAYLTEASFGSWPVLGMISMVVGHFLYEATRPAGATLPYGWRLQVHDEVPFLRKLSENGVPLGFLTALVPSCLAVAWPELCVHGR